MESFLTVVVAGGFALLGTIIGGALVWRGDTDRAKRDLLIKASVDFEDAWTVVHTQIIHSRLILEARNSGNSQHHDNCVNSAAEHRNEMIRAVNQISRIRGYIVLAGSDELADAQDRLARGIPDGSIAYAMGDNSKLLQDVENQARLWSHLGSEFRKKLKVDFDRIGSVRKSGFLSDLDRLISKLRS